MRMRPLALAVAITLFSLVVEALPGRAQQRPSEPAAPPAITPPRLPAAPSPAQNQPQSAPGSTSSSANIVRMLSVSAVTNMRFVSAAGAEIADIERIIERKADKKRFAVMTLGGFLGFGSKDVIVPLDALAVRGNEIVLRNMDLAQIEGLPELAHEDRDFRKLDSGQSIGLPQQ